MKAIFYIYKLLKYLFYLVLFSFIPALYAGTATVDLSVTLDSPTTTIEVDQPFSNLITIKNNNSSGSTIDASGAKIVYNIPSGASYNSFNGSGWSCTHDSSSATCTYGNSLTNGQTSNQLNLQINAPSSTGNISPDVTVSLSDSTDPDNSNDNASKTFEVGKSNLQASKTASKTTLQLGETFSYTISLSNPNHGSDPTVKARNVTISDTLPSQIQFVSLSDTSWCSESSGTITCSGSDLDVSNTMSVTIDVKAISGGTNIKNTATVDTDSSDYNTIPTYPNVSVDVELADITLSQSLIGGLTSTNAAVDSTVTYRIHVVNNGASPAEDVTLSDTLPSGVTYNGFSSSSEWSCSNNSGTIDCTLSDANLTNGESYDLDINVKMPSSHGDITNDASISTTSTESNTGNNDSSFLTHVKGADLDIEKTPDNGSTDIGTNYTYTVKVTNNSGLADAQNVSVVDNLDSSMSYISDTGGCTQNGQKLTCDLGNIASGNNKSFDVTVGMPTDSLNDVINSVNVTTDTDQENNTNTNDTATTHITGPNLNITKDANVSSVGLGKTFSYTINIKNVNSADATNADIEDQLPSGVTITDVTPDGWSCPSTPITGTFHCTKTTVPGGANDTLIFTATAPTDTTGNIQNTATVSHSLNSNDGSDSATVNVAGVVLSIDKVGSPTAVAGGLIDYNITITNTSYSDADDLTLTDDLTNLGSGYTINSIINSDGWSCSGTTTLTCTKSKLLAEGTSSTIHFNVNVPSNTSLGNKTNTASVTTTTTPAPTVSDSATTTIQGADIVVEKPTTTTAVANENVVFTVKVRNDGNAIAKDVNITNYFNTNNIADFTNILIDCNGGTNYTTGSPYKCQLGDINSGTTKTITISATAPNYDSNFPGNSNISNGSLAVTSTTQSDTTNDNKDWDIEVHGADIVVYKTADKSEVAVNDIVTYTINIKNQWEATATDINLTDDTLGNSGDKFTFVSGSLNYSSSDWTCTLNSSTNFTCTYKKDLSQNQTTSDITIQAKAPNNINAIDNNRDNQVVISTNTAEKETATTNRVVTPVTIRGADLDISKTVSPNPAKLSESVTYSITVTNNGLAEATNTDVNDTLPNGFTNISTNGCDNDGSSVSGQSVQCTLGNLAQGDSKTFTITTNAPDTNGNFDNTATTGSDTLEKATSNNSDTVTLQVKGADLNVDKWDSADPVATNSTYYYYIGVRNEGFSSAYGAEINDTLPSSGYRFTYIGPLEVQNSDWQCSKNGNLIHCNTKDSNFEMAPNYNSGSIVRFKVQAPSTPGNVQNTAIVDSNTSEAEPNDNTETENTQVIDIDLQARKYINNHNYGANENYIAIDGILKYDIYVSNRPIYGTNPPGITDVNVTDILPSNITDISITDGSRFTCDTSPVHPPALGVQGGDTLFCTMDDGENNPLKVSDGWVLVATIDAKAPDNGAFDTSNENNNFIINKYKAETSFGDQDLNNNAPTTGDGYLHTNTLVRGANISITKSVSSGIVGAEHQFGYTLSVKNWPRDNSTNEHDRPSTNATDIVVKDTLPSDVNYTSATGTDWSCNKISNIITCSYSKTLSPGDSASPINIEVTAPNTDSEVLTNEANATNDTPELTRLLPDNNDSAITTTQGTDIQISKTGPAEAGMSDKITYSITVTNSSAHADAKDVYIIDTLPNGATYDGNISDLHWTSSTEANGSIRFTYDQDLLMSTSTNFTFSSTLPHYTGTARNHVEAHTSTIETSSPNLAHWDTNIKGADLVFKNNPNQNPNPVGAYGHHEYYITIHNQGLSPASDINVTVNLDDAGSNPGWSDVNGSGSGWSCGSYDNTNKQLICHLPSLAGSSDSSLLTISSSAPNYNGNITNSATVTGKDDTNTTTGETISVVTNIKGSDLKIIKYAKDPDPSSDGLYHDDNITVGVGKPVDFKFSIRNDNLGLAKDINITDTFPDGFSDLNITDQGDWSCSFSGLILTCSKAELASNTDATDILISAKSPGSIKTSTNTVTTATTTQEIDNSNNTDNVKIKTEGATLSADLNASKTEVAMDEIFVYSLKITNSGKNDGIDVNATDTLPSDFTFIDINGSDSNWTCSQTSNTITCNQPLISAYNGSSILKLNVKAPQNDKGTYSNQIEINSDSIENPITAYAPDVRVIGADLNVSISAEPKSVLEDRNVTFNINVKDINISTAHNVILKQTFSQPINGLLITNGTSDCNLTDANQSVTCIYSHLDFNQDKNITIIATMPDTNIMIDPLTSTVTATTSTTQEDLVDHNASVNIRVIPIKPVADYRFEECKWDGTAGEVVDSINGLNGTATTGAQTENQILAQDDNNFSTKWRVGKFDGNGSITVPNNSKLQITGDQTISMWIKPTDFGSGNEHQIILSKSYDGEGAIYQLAGSGKLAYFYGISSNNYSSIYAGQAPVLNRWNHICVVRDFTNRKLRWYINGAMVNETDVNPTYNYARTTSKDLTIAKKNSTNYANFKGDIDEVEIYDMALDDKAVKYIYNNEKNGKNYNGTDRSETICSVDLKVIKTVLPSGNVGAESGLDYTIKITNISNEPVTKGFTLTDILPADVNYTSVGPSSNMNCNTSNDNNFTCTYPNTLIMNKNDSEIITAHATTANVDKKTITNTATAIPIQEDTDTSNNSDTASNYIIGTDLKITKTANPSQPNPGSAFVYTVRVENISPLTNARDITITDHYDNRLTYNSISTNTNEANSSIVCSTLGGDKISCTVNHLSMGNYAELYITMVSAGAATGLINEANVTSETIDTDTSNNHATLSIDTNNSASSIDIIRPSLKYFNNDVSANKYGNIATIGNTILVANNYTGTQKLNEINSTYANSSGYTNSSSATLNIIDTNSSNPDDNITIEYAGLFWGGHLHGDDKNETGNNIPFNTVKFITPDGTVHNITVNKTDLNGSINPSNRADFYHFKKGDEDNNTANMGNYRIFYGAKADITDIIRDLNGSINGNYTVADMEITKGDDNPDWAPTVKTENNTTTTSWTRFRDYGYFGGWSMVVAYSINHRYHREVKFKNLSTFSGFVDLVPPGPGGTTQLPISISGFITPIHGNIDSSLYDFTQGGDIQLSLEGMTVKDKNGVQNAIIEDTNNTNNIFNDTITLKDVSNNDISKNPNVTYNVGNDIDQYNLDSKYDSSDNCANDNGRPCYLSNSQRDTQVTISVKESGTLDGTEYPSEQSFVQMLSMQTQIFTPDFIDSYKECFKLKSQISPQLGWVPCSDPTPLLRRGDIIKYRITAINTGDDYAQDVYIEDNLPKEVTYEQNSSIVTHLLPFDNLETNSPCSSDDYDYNESIRTQCFEHLKALIENNTSSPLTTVTPIDGNETIDHNYNDMTYSDVNNSLVYQFDTFPKNNLVWIEFNTTINGYAALGKTFKNKMSITFTNPTLADYNLTGGTVTQVSLPVESSPIYFNWDDINIVAKDIGRNSVGAKIVNAPFDLNLTLSGISTFDQTDANTSIYLNSLRIIDVYNNTNSDIYHTIVDSNTGIPLTAGSYTWLTHNTSYPKASRELGFDMNITIKSNDGNYSESKMYPYDFNSTALYAGDVFTTRPKEFTMTLSGANTLVSGGYTIVKASQIFSVNVNASDYNGSSSADYNASLTKGSEISVGLDSTYSSNPACISQNDLNISNLSFSNGVASTNSLNYKNVGVVKLILKDSNWTARDNPNDCNATSIGDNNSSDADGLISCSTDGNSTSIVFEPDHFAYTNTNVSDFNGGSFTYMVLNPINDSMFAKVTTTLEARNSDDNITSFFSNTCFAYNTDVNLVYNAQSKNLADLNMSIANENNLTNIASNSAINTAGNSMVTTAYKNQFANGVGPLTFRLAIERNSTTPLQPALINPQNLKGSITDYLGIANADVTQGAGTDISGAGNLHYLFGRVHSPDYRFAGNSGTVKIYYEAYCKDCNQTYRNNMNILGTDSIDSVNWYINTLHGNLNDGNVTNYTPIKNTTLSAYSSTGVSNGIETLVATAPSLPYIDKIDINATDWITFDPKDFILEFQDDQKDWAGQGKLGHIIDTNVSKRSNRRLNW